MTQRIGVLGGTFNPIHNGHIAAAQEIRARLKLDKVLFVPSYIPPHKQEEDAPSAAQRLEMVRLALAGHADFEPSDIEIGRGGRSYTIDTIKALRASHPGTELFFIAGLDAFLDIQSWHCWQELLGLCHFVVIARPGHRFVDLLKLNFMKDFAKDLAEIDEGARTHALVRSGSFSIYVESVPLHDISSTDIRTLMKTGRAAKYFLPEAVETYIIKNKIYA